SCRWRVATSMLRARPRRPSLAAVSAAPTVPECSTARPVLQPGLIPETTRSGGWPEPPRPAGQPPQPGGAAGGGARPPAEPGQVDALGVDALLYVDLADGGRRAAHLPVGCHDDHVQPVVDKRPCQGVPPRRGDARGVRHPAL